MPFPSSGVLLNPGVEPMSPSSPALAGKFFTNEPRGKPTVEYYSIWNKKEMLFLLKYICFTMLCSFLLCSKVNQSHIFIYPFFGFSSTVFCYHKALNRFPYALQLFLISYLLNRKEILQYVTIWMNLKNIMLTEISQTLKDKILLFQLYQILRAIKNHKIGKWNDDCQGLRKGKKGELLFNRSRFSVLQDEKSYLVVWWWGCTMTWLYLISLKCTLK